MEKSMNCSPARLQQPSVQSAPPSYEQATSYAQATAPPQSLEMQCRPASTIRPATVVQSSYPRQSSYPIPYNAVGGNFGGDYVSAQQLFASQQGVVMQAGQQGAPIVIIQQQVVLPLGSKPTIITCPVCGKKNLSRISHTANARTHLSAAILCLLGLWCFAYMPYCMSSCLSTKHYCRDCNVFLGTCSDRI